MNWQFVSIRFSGEAKIQKVMEPQNHDSGPGILGYFVTRVDTENLKVYEWNLGKNPPVDHSKLWQYVMYVRSDS